jgi:hypothetical protein
MEEQHLDTNQKETALDVEMETIEPKEERSASKRLGSLLHKRMYKNQERKEAIAEARTFEEQEKKEQKKEQKKKKKRVPKQRRAGDVSSKVGDTMRKGMGKIVGFDLRTSPGLGSALGKIF